jgi:hypothetical protein
LELKRFSRFIQSSYFNNNASIIPLLDILKRRHPNYDQTALDKEKIYAKIFKTKYDDGKMRYLMSQLFSLLEKFILAELLNQNLSQELEIVRLREWRRKGVDKVFWNTQKQLSSNLQSNRRKDYEFYKNKLELETENYLKLQGEGKRDVSTDISSLIKSQDIHYLYGKLRLTCEIHNRKNILDTQQTDTQFRILNNPILKDYENIPAIRIYRDILILLEEGKLEHYWELAHYLEGCLSLFSKEEYREMFTYLNNFCIQKINKGNATFLETLFSNYKFLLANSIFIIDENFNLFDFKNIATIAIRLGQFDWTLSFTKKYQKYLKAEYKESAVAYNNARVHFYNKDYKLALRELIEVDYSDLYYELGARSLLLKIYYEQNDIDQFYAINDSLQSFIKRNKEISSYQKETYLNFAKIAKRLFNFKTKSHPIAESKLSVSKNKIIADSTWIDQKIDELK